MMSQSVKRQRESPCDNEDQQDSKEDDSVYCDRPAQNAELEEHMVLRIQDAELKWNHGRQAAEEPGNSAQRHAAQ